MNGKIETKTIVKIFLAVFALLLLIFYRKNISEFFGAVISASTPLFIGCAAAYVLNILMGFYERHFFPKSVKVFVNRNRRMICLLLAILTLVAIVALVTALVVPQLISCAKLLLAEIPGAVDTAIDLLEKLNILSSDIADKIASVDWQSKLGQIMHTLSSGISSVMDFVFSAVTSVVSGITTAFLAIIFAVYLLSGKDRLCSQFRMVIIKISGEKRFEKINHVLTTANDSFHKFIVGQCTEAVILGVLCMLGMLILRLPYAPMIGAVTAFTALIPVVGAFIGGAIGAFLILMESPVKALIFIVFLVVLQQVEGNIIYPRFVGSSIGLPGIWVLAAVTIGGGVLGIFGMLLGVPIAATAYRLLKEQINGMPSNTISEE